MEQFCKDVLDFLQSEYNDAYEYDLEISRSLHSSDMAELKIKVSPGCKIKINNYCMQYLFSVYRSGNFIQERKQWQWQKELIDMIEGS